MPIADAEFKFKMEHLDNTYEAVTKDTKHGPVLRIWARERHAIMYIETPPEVLRELLQKFDAFSHEMEISDAEDDS